MTDRTSLYELASEAILHWRVSFGSCKQIPTIGHNSGLTSFHYFPERWRRTSADDGLGLEHAALLDAKKVGTIAVVMLGRGLEPDEETWHLIIVGASYESDIRTQRAPGSSIKGVPGYLADVERG